MKWKISMKYTCKSNEIFKGKHGPLIIAEIGGNHGGNFNKALKLTMDAIEADVDYIKYQIYTGDGLVAKSISPDRYNHFRNLELNISEYLQLARICKKYNVGFMASIWQEEFINIFNNYSNIYKVGSGDFTNYMLIDQIIKTKKPMILSTGLASEEEVLNVLNHIKKRDRDYNSNSLAILQCTTMYPINYNDANLSVIEKYKKLTNLTVGYSDHTVGYFANIIAYAMGAEIIEFHFTDDKKNSTYRDHQISLDKHDVFLMLEEIENINKLKGNNKKTLLPVEIENNHHITFRRSIYTKKHINKGQVIEFDDIVALRPIVGIDARYYENVIGRKVNRNFNKGEPISEKDLYEYD